jgi:dCTP deaminase
MAVISVKEIKRRLDLDVTENESLVITPLVKREEALSADSVDLTLGTHFLLPQVPPLPFATLDRSELHSGQFRVHVPLGKYLVLPAHQTALGATLEYIKLPADLSGQILTKSSLARTFVAIETAPWIHPLYRGCLTLEIANVSNTPLLLHPGVPVGQLVLMKVEDVDLDEEAKKPIGGKYLGPVYPEPPNFPSLRNFLWKKGVDRPEIDIPEL